MITISLIIVAFERRTTLQILSDAVEDALISTTQSIFCALLTSAISICVFQSFGEQPVWLFFALLVFAIVIRICAEILRRQRIHRCEGEILLFVDEVVTAVRSGVGIRAAFIQGLVQVSPYLRHLLQHCIRAAESNGQIALVPSPLLGLTLKELTECLGSTHQALKRCSALRHRLKVLSGFRRRSGQVTAQIRAQSFVVGGMYLATILFVHAQFGLEEIKLEVLVSVALFMMGVFVMWSVQRGQKWKI